MIRCMYPCLILMVLTWSLIYVLDQIIPIEIRQAYSNWMEEEFMTIGSFAIKNKHIVAVGEFLICFIIFFVIVYYYFPRYGKEVKTI